MLLFDIGANKGDATWHGLQKGFDKIIALEPAPKMFNILYDNYKILWHTRHNLIFRLFDQCY